MERWTGWKAERNASYLGGRGALGGGIDGRRSEHRARRRGQLLRDEVGDVRRPLPHELARPVVVVRALDAHLQCTRNFVGHLISYFSFFFFFLLIKYRVFLLC